MKKIKRSILKYCNAYFENKFLLISFKNEARFGNFDQYEEQREKIQVAVVPSTPRRVVRMVADILPVEPILEEVSGELTSDTSSDSSSDSAMSNGDDDKGEPPIQIGLCRTGEG